MSSLSDRIHAADDVERRVVDVPEWDVKIEMRTPSVRQRSDLISQYMEDGTVNLVRLYPSLLIATCFDPETGEQAFTVDDMDWLADKSAKVLERLADIASVMSGIKDAAEQVEQGKGDSSTTP